METSYPHVPLGKELDNILTQLLGRKEATKIEHLLHDLLDGRDAGRNGLAQPLADPQGSSTTPSADTFAVDVKILNNPAPLVNISSNTGDTPVVILGPNSSTNLQSDASVPNGGSIVIAATSGNNYIDITSSGNMPGDTVVAGSGSDTIVGNGGNSLLVGGSGNTYIGSGGGRDTLVGGSGNNTLVAGGQSVVEAGRGVAAITAGQFTSSHDTIYAGSGLDTITLKKGDNVVHGPSTYGLATIKAGSGQDTIFGGAGAETVVGGAKTTVHLGTGQTTLQVDKTANDTIYGGANSGSLSLNKSSSDATITKIDGTDQTKITFASGGSITTVGNVDIIFKDHTNKTV